MTTNKSSEITTVPSYGSWHWPANKKTTERFKKNSSPGDPRPCFRLLFPVPINIDSIYTCEKHIPSNNSRIIRNTRSLWIVRPDLPVDVL